MENGIWIAIIACIAGGAELHRRKYGSPKKKRSMLVTYWIVVGIGVCAGLIAAFSG